MEQLVCMESSRGIRAFEDPVLLKDDRVLRNLLKAEDNYLPQGCYFNCVQTDIKPFMRKMVSEWMAEVCGEQRTEEEVFPLAMNYVDRFLCVQNIHRTRLQCLGAACMLLASKLKENYHMAAETLVGFTDNSITLQELRDMESLVLQVLKWDLSAVTPNDFVAHIAHRLPIHPATLPNVQKHAQTFIALCAAESKFMLYAPSMIAAGCIGVAVRGLGIYPSVTEDLHAITHIELEVLGECQEAIQDIITHNLKLLLIENQAGGSSSSAGGSEAEGGVLSGGSSTGGKGGPHSGGSGGEEQQSTTPTDVRDINLMAVDSENEHLLESGDEEPQPLQHQQQQQQHKLSQPPQYQQQQLQQGHCWGK